MMKQKTVKVPIKVDFNTDLLFLNFLISKTLENSKIIVDLKGSGKRLLNDETLDEFTNNIVLEIFSSISPVYNQVLMNYFSKDGLQKYIVTSVYYELTNKFLQINTEKLRR